MTLRPEPFTALLTVGVLACAIRLHERGSGAPLAGMAVLVPLAVTGHHAGIVALAPVLAVSPEIVRWARRRSTRRLRSSRRLSPSSSSSSSSAPISASAGPTPRRFAT